jgi:hypothetical protein
MNFDSAAEVETFYDRLDKMKGLDENNNNLDKAQVSGTIYVPTLTATELASLQSRYTHLTILYDAIVYKVTYVNYNGSKLYETLTIEGQKAIDPVATGKISTPTKPSTEGYTYSYSGWDYLPNVTDDITITAQYKANVRYYTVSFVNNGTTLQTASVPYGSTVTYNGTRPADTDTTLFAGWHPKPGRVTNNVTYNALYAVKNSNKEITDSWETIFANVDNGTYTSKYGEGDYKKLELGSEGWVYMRIIGFYDDDKADGTGKVAITWMADNVLKNKTGSLSNWETCAIRTYLNNDFYYNNIPATVRNRLALITLPTGYVPVGGTASIITNDYVWIPSKDNDFIDSRDYSYPETAAKPNSSNSNFNTSSGETHAYWLREGDRKVYYATSSSSVYEGAWAYGSLKAGATGYLRICFATN